MWSLYFEAINSQSYISHALPAPNVAPMSLVVGTLDLVAIAWVTLILNNVLQYSYSSYLAEAPLPGLPTGKYGDCWCSSWSQTSFSKVFTALVKFWNLKVNCLFMTCDAICVLDWLNVNVLFGCTRFLASFINPLLFVLWQVGKEECLFMHKFGNLNWESLDVKASLEPQQVL